MSDPIYNNCGKAKSEHVEVKHMRSIPWVGVVDQLTRFCPTSTFQPKPEPLKAKPGVRYQRLDRGANTGDFAYGTHDGKLRRDPGEHKDCWSCGDFNIWTDWQEVTE